MRWMALAVRVGVGAAMVVACNGDKGEVVDTGDTDTNTEPRCQNAVLEAYPEDATSGVYAWSAVDIAMSQPDTSAVITVLDDAGAEVAGVSELLDDDRRVQWTPDAPMAVGDYTYSMSWGCDDVAAGFSVGDAGTTPTGDPAGLAGRTYILDLKQARFVGPQGIGPALETQLEVKLLLGVFAADATSLQFIAGAEDQSGGQDTEASTTLFDDPAAFSDPRFSISQDALPLVVEGDPITVTDLDISGSFSADQSAIVGFRMSTTLDTRDLKTALNQKTDEGPCNLFAASFGVKCEACPDGAGEYCINLVVADLTLPEAGYAMVEIP